MKSSITLFILFFSLIINAQTTTLFVGTYTNGESEGVYTLDFNAQTGELSNKKLIVKETNPSFLTFSKDKQFLYVISEVDNFNESGSVSTYYFNQNKEYQKLNTLSTNGAHPCHITINESQNKLAISNYSGGTISLHEISSGVVQPAFQVFDHRAPGEKSHAHMALFKGDQLFTADLGRNFIKEYTANSVANYYESNTYSMMKGAGPRHFKMTEDGTFMYVINELNSTISVLKKSDKGGFSRIQNFYTTAINYEGDNSCADIHISPDEQFVYGSNRGENTIVVFKRDLTTGRLSKVQSVSVQGDWPRNFVIDPTGSFLLVANERSNAITVFKIDKTSGELTFTSKQAMPAPVCLLF